MAKFATKSAKVQQALANRQPFTTHGALSATTDQYDMVTGRLPEPDAGMFKRAAAAGMIEYAVYSYGTPILWIMFDGTVISPDHKYSPTTTQHQNLARHGFHITTQRFRVTWWEDGIRKAEKFYTEQEAGNRRFDLMSKKIHGVEVELDVPAKES